MKTLDKLHQKSIWLTLRDWRAFERAAKKRSAKEGQPVTSGALARRVLHEWIEANK